MDYKKQNFDAIFGEKIKIPGPPLLRKPKPARKVVVMQEIRRIKKPSAPRQKVTVAPTPVFSLRFLPAPVQKQKYGFLPLYRRIPQAVPLILALILAFGGGMWYALKTPSSAADSPQAEPQVKSAQVFAPIPLDAKLEVMPEQTKLNTAITNDVLFNTPLEMLKDYLASSAAQDQLLLRKAKLREFLAKRNSPLEPQADLIAEQNHWKLILAISFAESTLGEKCFDFNCSGIGGSQIRSYKSFDNWILDFNRLLEVRYKDKTLEQMCGVYVQPCNPNWLLATKQILTALDEDKIE